MVFYTRVYAPLFLALYIKHLHLLHPCHLPSRELHHNFVQLGALAQSLNAWCLGIIFYLFHSLLPLFRSLIISVHALGQVLDFQNVAMSRLIVRHIWQEEEVAIPMVELQLRCRKVKTV